MWDIHHVYIIFEELTDNRSAFDAIARIVIGSGHRRQFPVRRRNVAELVAHIGPPLVQRGAWSHWLIVNYIV